MARFQCTCSCGFKSSLQEEEYIMMRPSSTITDKGCLNDPRVKRARYWLPSPLHAVLIRQSGKTYV